MYRCKHCGIEFEDRYKLSGHSTHCKMNPNYEKNTLQSIKNVNNDKKIKIKDKTEYHCQYCDKICIGKNSLIQHEIRCKDNVNSIKLSPICVKGNVPWNKGLSVIDNDSIKRQALSLKKSYKDGKIINHNKGKKCSEEQKIKIRLSTIKYIKSLNGSMTPRYSLRGCDYINSLNERMGWNLQHAENGGEIEVCGYYLDGYDKERNIAFEYDESKHYKDVYNNILREKDIIRHKIIMEHLKCKFYRYNEVLDLFYEVI